MLYLAAPGALSQKRRSWDASMKVRWVYTLWSKFSSTEFFSLVRRSCYNSSLYTCQVDGKTTKVKFPAISVKRPKNFVTLTHQISFYHTQELIIEDPVVCRAKRYREITGIALRRTASVRFKLRNSQNKKWADKNSSEQLLWIELAWIYRFWSSHNEQ